MESLNPLNNPILSKKEIVITKKTAVETELFLKSVDSQGSTLIGTLKDKKFTLSTDAKQMDLQQIVMTIFGEEASHYTENEQTLIIKGILDSGLSLNSTDQNKRTVLHYAARFGHLELVKELLSQTGVEVDAKDEIGRTALSYAVEQGNKEIVELLIKKGANVNAVSDNFTPPSFSSKVDQKEDDTVPRHDKSYYWSMTPLHYAVMQGHEEIAKLLIHHGATIDARNSDGDTALYFCIMNGNAKLVPALINSNSVNLPNNYGYTPLHLAIFYSSPEITKILLSSNADPNISDTALTKKSPLHFAVLLPSDEIARLLLGSGAKVDALDSNGDQPIHSVIDNIQSLDCLDLLVTQGANINADGCNAFTPLQKAEFLGNETTVRTLLLKGANPNLINTNGTALLISNRTNPSNLYSEETNLLTQECKRRKNLSLQFGISGNSKVSPDPNSKSDFSLEGSTRSGGVEIVKENMNQFPIANEKLLNEAWTEVTSAFTEIPDAFNQSSSEEQSKILKHYLKQLDQGKPIVIPTGWEGHTIYLVFMKTKDGLICIECNRGERSIVSEGGFTIYQLKNPNQVNEDTLQRLLIASDRTFTEDFIHHRLGSSKVDHVGFKDQKAGSCSFTSAKTAVFSTIYVLLKAKGLDNSTALAQTKLLYLPWTQQSRAQAINKMLDEYEINRSPLYSRDYNLLLATLSKMKLSSPNHPAYIKARQRLLDFLVKEVPKPWDINFQVDDTYKSPLTYAVHSKQPELIKVMLKNGGDINAKDPGHWTPLQRAISEGDKEMVTFLIKQGAKLTTDPGTIPTIHIALRFNHSELASYLLNKMKKKGIDLNPSDASGITLLGAAAELNARKIMDFLIDNKCDINARNASGLTAFQYSIWIGQKETVDYFIEKGVSLQQDPQNGMHPLQLAINQGHFDIATRLAGQMKQNQSSLNDKDAYHQYTPLELAAYKKNPELLDQLIKLGAEWDDVAQASVLSAILVDSSQPGKMQNVDDYINFLKYLFDKKGVSVFGHHVGYRPIDICLLNDVPFPIIKYLIDKINVSGALGDLDNTGKTIFDHAMDYQRYDVCDYISHEKSYLFRTPPIT